MTYDSEFVIMYVADQILISNLLLICTPKAFEETWKVACSSHSSEVIMYIPAGKTFLLNQTRFNGPCKSPITVQVTNTYRLPAI